MKRKLKKFFAVFSVLICLVSVNLSLFTVGAAANVVDAGEFSHRTIGCPVSLNYYWSYEGYLYSGCLNRPNVYFYDSDGTVKWFEGTTETYLFDFTYNSVGDSFADVYLGFYNSTWITDVSIDAPILFSDWNDLDSFYNLHLDIDSPRDALGNNLSTIIVDYDYTFVIGYMVDGDFVTSLHSVSDSVVISPSGSYFDVPLFNRTILTDNVISGLKSFRGGVNDSTYFCYLSSASFSPVGVYSKLYYLEPSFNSGNRLLSSYMSVQDLRFRSIYEASEYSEVIVFEDVSWTDWIVNSVGAFFDFEIIPGLSFAGMLGLLVGMSLFVVFLKIFAGG